MFNINIKKYITILVFLFFHSFQFFTFAQDFLNNQAQELKNGWLWAFVNDEKEFSPIDTAFFSDLTSLFSGKKTGKIFLKNEFYLTKPWAPIPQGLYGFPLDISTPGRRWIWP